jgi:hypothetical protein
MATLIAVPVLGALVILQSAVISRVPLISGTADLILLALIAWAVQERVTTAWHWSVMGALMVSLVSASSASMTLGGYLLATGIAVVLRYRVWQIRLLAMLAATFFGTIVIHALTIISLRLNETAIPILESFNTITLPSILLNLLVAVPMYALISDLANWLYPEEIEL